MLKEHVDAFSWKPTDMMGITRSLIEHRLNINPSYAPIKQKKCGMVKERNEIVNTKVKALLEARFKRSTQFQNRFPAWF